jgi:hypothetical protein
METKCCKHCNQNFDLPGKIFSNHVRWCSKNPSRNNTANIKKASDKYFDEVLGTWKNFVVTCNKCDIDFTVKERSKKHPEKEVYYCSRSCANARNHSDETKTKISASLIGNVNNIVGINIGGTSKIPISKKCPQCNVEIYRRRGVAYRTKYCSPQCYHESRRSSNDFLNYRSDCKFSFNVWKYPDRFDLDLIRKHGWYSAANRGNNLEGVSRDHKISVLFGWQNNVCTKIMSHPANCELMQHKFNSTKHSKCSIELERLLEEISVWDSVV